MEKCEVGRKSSRTVPVIIEHHENATKKTKLMVPSNYTAGHLANILRSRMRLLPYHSVYLFLKSKQSPILMSKSIGQLHHKHRDEKGLLRLIHAGQGSFGFRGNIRAIRFRQKWLENLHNTLHQDVGGPQSYSGGPPPHFPPEPPSTANFEAPLDLANLYGSFEDESYEDSYNDGMEFSDVEIEESAPILPDSSHSSNMTGSLQSSALANSLQSSALTNSSHLSALTDFMSIDQLDHWMNPSLTDTLLPTYMTNSVQIPITSSLFSNQEEDTISIYVEIDLASQNVQNAVSESSSIPAIPNIPANVQPPNIPNPQEPLHNLVSLYESDSDFYDSDKDVDTTD